MPIAILGTGRSGTSMVTRMLNLCGLYLGDQDRLWDSRLKPGMNPTGYWEHCEIHSFMDRLFEHLGGTWENPPVLSCGWEYAPDIEPFYAEAKDLIARLFGSHEEWGWKLPKATVTIAFWQRVVPDLKFIICVRNPLDFASSLGKHSPVSRAHLFAMWQYYNYMILSVTRPEDRIVTFYEDYFPCSRSGLSPLLDFLGLLQPAPNDQVDQCLRSFFNQDLNHHSSTFLDVLADTEVPYVTQQLYLELLSGNASASNLPMLSHSKMLLPLLQRTLIGEGTLDGSGAVSRAQHEKLKRKLAALRGERGSRLDFLKNALSGLRLNLRRPRVSLAGTGLASRGSEM
ncbi:MAG: sulfotransferase family protein [Janthinobacterium lividum]